MNQDNNSESFGDWDKSETRDRDRSERRRERKSRWGDSDNTGDNAVDNTDHATEPPAHEVPDFGDNNAPQQGDATSFPPPDHSDQFQEATEQHNDYVNDNGPGEDQPTNDNNDYSEHYNEQPAPQYESQPPQESYTENDNHDVSDMNVNNEQAVEPAMEQNNHVEDTVTHDAAPVM